MKISSRLDYALSCVLRVADAYGRKRAVPVREISRKEKLEPDYVEQLLMAMKRGGIVRSIRGRMGGYALSGPPETISVKGVVKAIERDTLELVCFRKKGRRNKCVHLDDCKVRVFWIDMKKDMESFLDSYSLKELLDLRKKEENWR